MPIWFYWGQPHLGFLRYFTLVSACLHHPDVHLVIPATSIAAQVNWQEKQDFQNAPIGPNWLPNVYKLPVQISMLESVAPHIAALKAPDIQTSDLLGWHLLANHGGTVADMDIIFLRPVPEITQDVQIVRYKGHPKPGYVPVGFMQGRPSAHWADSLGEALRAYDPQKYQSCGTLCAPNVPAVLSDRVVFPWAGDYAWDHYHRWLFLDNKFPPVPDDCCGVHWYGGHNQLFNRRIAGPVDVTRGCVAWAMRQVIAAMPHSWGWTLSAREAA